MRSMAMGVTWPIMVLKAKETMTPRETPLARVRVSKTSAGTIPGVCVSVFLLFLLFCFDVNIAGDKRDCTYKKAARSSPRN